MSEEDQRQRLPDESQVRRFASAVGLVLLGFSLAGGHILPEIHGFLVGVTFDRPWVLVLFLVLTSVYATYRYWYFAIKVPVSRVRIRRYLRQDKTMLVYKGVESAYKSGIMQTGNILSHCHALLEEKCPPGHSPFEFIIYTDALTQATDGYIRHLVANRVDNYFPGIVKTEITTWDEGAISWASVNKLKAGTAVQVFLEDLDQWVPVMINGVAVIAFAFLVFYPWLRG